MFCTKCGLEYNEELEKCPNCEVSENATGSDQIGNVSEKTNSLSSFLFSTAIVILILGIISAILIAVGGFNISQIESVGGRTLEEAYYYDLGKVYYGISLVMFSFSLFCFSVLTYMGKKDIDK